MAVTQSCVSVNTRLCLKSFSPPLAEVGTLRFGGALCLPLLDSVQALKKRKNELLEKISSEESGSSRAFGLKGRLSAPSSLKSVGKSSHVEEQVLAAIVDGKARTLSDFTLVSGGSDSPHLARARLASEALAIVQPLLSKTPDDIHALIANVAACNMEKGVPISDVRTLLRLSLEAVAAHVNLMQKAGLGSWPWKVHGLVVLLWWLGVRLMPQVAVLLRF